MKPPRFPAPEDASRRAPYREPAERAPEIPDATRPLVRRAEPPTDDPAAKPRLDPDAVRSLAELSAGPPEARHRWSPGVRLVAIPILGVALALRRSLPWPVVAALAAIALGVIVLDLRRRA